MIARPFASGRQPCISTTRLSAEAHRGIVSSTSRPRILFLAAYCLALGSCSDDWKRVQLPNGTAVTDVLLVDLYGPFDRSTLLRNSEDAYGEPRSSGSESKGNDHVFFKEYVGKHGRIRVYEEAYQSEAGWESAQWLEVYPGKLYLRDVIRKQYLADVGVANGNWKLSLMPSDRSWHLTLELNGEAITRIADLPRD